MTCVLFVVQTDTQLNSIFICLFTYLFVFYIIFIHFHYSKKTHLSITDMLPHLHTIYKDVILLNVLREV